MGDEGSLEGHEARNALDHGVGVERGEGDSGGRGVETGHVAVGTEETDVAAGGEVGLHALEAGEGVVEDAGRGVQGEVLVGCDARGGPAGGGGPFDGEHMVWGG